MAFLLTTQLPTATKLRSADFLRQNSPGPYTSLVVRGDGRIPNLDSHIRRLSESLAIRRSEGSSKNWKCKPWGTSYADNLDILRALLVEKLQTAVQKVHAAEGPAIDASVVALLVQGNK
jgi:hypothetical protein